MISVLPIHVQNEWISRFLRYPLVLDMYWLTHVLLYHKAGPFSLSHARCVAQKSDRCDPTALWDGSDAEILTAAREVERLAPLLVLFLDAEDSYSTGSDSGTTTVGKGTIVRSGLLNFSFYPSRSRILPI